MLAPVGTVALTFANGNHATFAYTVNAVTQTKQITLEISARRERCVQI